MPRTHQIYQTNSVFIGPSPSSGYHFLSGVGNLNNAWEDLGKNNNLLKSIQRVQSASYSFNIDYASINQIGKRGSVYQPIINSPSVNFSFDYINCSVLNELRLGFNANYYNEYYNTSFYSDNFGQSLISGLVSRSLKQPSSFPYWPLDTRDKRNLFVIVGQEGVDVNKTGYSVADPSSKSYSVYCFGDVYLTSYITRGSIGSFPTTSVSFICENLEVVSSGSGIQIPSIDTKTKDYVNTHKFVIPSNLDITGEISSLLPGDTLLSFSSIPKHTGILAMYGTGYENGGENTNIVDLTANFSDIKIQNYEIGINFPRKSLFGLTYKLPVDRPIIFPVFATINTSFIVGDNQTGRLVDLVDKNNDYNVKISIENPSFSTKQGIGLQYDIKRAKLNSLNIDSNIGNSKIVSLGFTTELDPDNLSKGLFVSGRLNVSGEFGGDFLLKHSNEDRFLINNTRDDALLVGGGTLNNFNIPY